MSAGGEGGARGLDDGVRRDAELAEEGLVVRRGSEVLDREGLEPIAECFRQLVAESGERIT